MNTFWIAFLISQAVAAAQAFVIVSGLKPAVKSALLKFIAAGQALANALGTGSGTFLESLSAVPFNPAQLATWAEAMALVKVINASPQFTSAGISILPQDPTHQHSGAYLPPWDPGPHGDPEPHIGDAFWIHFRYSNKFEGMNAGLVREKFRSFPNSPDYVLGQLLIEVQQGART
jgi:hypothetical protein